MTYLRSKRVIAFFLTGILFFVFEGAIPFNLIPKRNERNLDNEVSILYKKIGDLEAELAKKNNSTEPISANLVFGGGYLFSDSIFFNKGIEDGVGKGDFVIYNSAIAVARVEEVFSGYSKAVPFSAFGQKNSLRSGVEKSVLFEGEGKGGSEISALLSNGSGVNAGDAVYLAQNPRFLVGIVDSAEKRKSRDFEEIDIVLPFSLRSISEVSIIKDHVKK